jgi:hypothetical protein
MPDPTFDPMLDLTATPGTIRNTAIGSPAAKPPRRKIPRWLFVALGVTTLAVGASGFTSRQAAEERHRAEQSNRAAHNDVVYQSRAASGAKDDLSNAKLPGRYEQNQMQTPLVTIQQLDAILATALAQNARLVQLNASNGSVDQYNQAVAASDALVEQWNALIKKLRIQADTVD